MRKLEQEYQEAMELCMKKNKDYGNAKEVAGQLMKLMFPKGIKLETSDQFNEFNMFVMVMSKVIRFANLSQSKVGPNFESIEDTLKDLGNYAFILKNMIHNNTMVKLEGSVCGYCGHHESDHAPIPETGIQPCTAEGCMCENFMKEPVCICGHPRSSHAPSPYNINELICVEGNCECRNYLEVEK